MRYEYNNDSDGKQMLVLGARKRSGNIGDAIAQRGAARGWAVVGDDCLVSVSGNLYGVPCFADWSRFDLLVITLGHTSLTPMREVDDQTIIEVIWGSLTLPLLCARQYIQERSGPDWSDVVKVQPGWRGRILFIGSYAHDHVLTNCTAYCAAKAGLAHAVRTMAWELTPQFLVSIIHPYHVPSTPMGERVVEGMIADRGMTREEAENYQRKDARLPEHLAPEEIAEYANWMLDAPEAAWISGQGINLYGGVR